MTVAAILRDKGRDTFSASPSTTLAEIARILADKRIGAVMITNEGGSLVGIVSERDIIRAVAMDGASALQALAGSYMTTMVVTCTEDCSVGQVMARMTAGNFRHVPVLRDGVIIGMISNRDLVRHRLAQAESEAEEMRSYILTS
ncbi:MAG: CBS domain-containing protein [Hyphomicrobiales bacterium]